LELDDEVVLGRLLPVLLGLDELLAELLLLLLALVVVVRVLARPLVLVVVRVVVAELVVVSEPFPVAPLDPPLPVEGWAELVVVVRDVSDGVVWVEVDEDDDEDDVVGEDEVEGELDDDELEDELVAAVEAGAHDSLSDLTELAGTDAGRVMLDGGVPGGTSTVNDVCAPPTSVTVITHSSADAAGTDTNANREPAAVAATTNFALLSTVDCLLPTRSRALVARPNTAGAIGGKLTRDSIVFNAEPTAARTVPFSGPRCIGGESCA
jgi:hypothetical protein